MTDEAAVWLVNGTPARMVWDGVRYRVTDTPTPLTEDAWCPALTHAAARIIGWRFQGTTAGGQSMMFDIVEGDQGWRVLRVYD
ncbi:hypothetical protein GCM10025866_33120 [Naasia aerilata]|uniref:Uncharacterized protein n=2 Tax=Naasia aerilata TaxID=1162966 RepID=A0ABM8GGC1_9MICO|nr:hypothetical protein GCM10025866_33120 [Naasia aerilata]